MTLRLAVAAPLLALAACGSTPDAANPDRILVIPVGAARQAAATVRAAPAVEVAASTRHAPTLTVEESARINTSEMWSEPIAADTVQMVIE